MKSVIEVHNGLSALIADKSKRDHSPTRSKANHNKLN